jgi:hypothetical protein
MAATANELSGQAHQLQTAIGFFQLGDELAPAEPAVRPAPAAAARTGARLDRHRIVVEAAPGPADRRAPRNGRAANGRAANSRVAI